MLFAALFAAIFTLAFAKSQHKGHGGYESSRCSKQLAAVVYDPYNYWSKYLRGISVELKDIATFYELDLGTNMIINFQNKYGVSVSLFEPFNEVLHYSTVVGNGDVTELPQTLFDHNNARSVLNLGSYYQNSTHYVYNFLSFSKSAQMVEVSIAREIQATTVTSGTGGLG